MTATTLHTPDGCGWCGHPERGHDAQFHLYDFDRHPYYQPTDRQRLARMLERRARRLQQRGTR